MDGTVIGWPMNEVMTMNDREKEIIAYFNRLDRKKFMENHQERAELDQPVSIGYGQTISQPSLVLKMTLALDLHPELRVLEIGTGSGYQTALLAAFSKAVYTVERMEPLHSKAKERLKAEGYSNIHYRLGDGSRGWPEHQPYDRIMVTASASLVPRELLEQLNVGGKMIIPVGDRGAQKLQFIEKDEDGQATSTTMADVSFVRLVGAYD